MRGRAALDHPAAEEGFEPRRGAETKGEILRAATSIVIESGYDGCSMRAVAARVGVKAASIYNHFASKDDLIEAILNIGIETLHGYVTTELARLPPAAPFEVKVRVATAAHLRCLIGPAIPYLQVYDHLPPILKRSSRTMRGTYARLWYDLFACAMRQNRIDTGVTLKVLVPYYLGSLNRVPEWIHGSGSTADQVADLAVRTLLAGVARKG